jgi:hypothetical protein
MTQCSNVNKDIGKSTRSVPAVCLRSIVYWSDVLTDWYLYMSCIGRALAFCA